MPTAERTSLFHETLRARRQLSILDLVQEATAALCMTFSCQDIDTAVVFVVKCRFLPQYRAIRVKLLYYLLMKTLFLINCLNQL
jgi:hypothetical protein